MGEMVGGGHAMRTRGGEREREGALWCDVITC